LYWELQQARIPFHLEKKVAANYENQTLATRNVNFFVVRQELLVSAVAVQELDTLLLSKFRNYMKYFGCPKGLIINFNAVCLRFNYLEL
jgi:GxxExxY protein